MDISKIEKLISKLAKSGDKETIRDIVDLLEEVASYSGKTPQTPKKAAPVVEAREMIPENAAGRAAMILDGVNDYSPRNIPQQYNIPYAPIQENYRSAPVNPLVMEDKPDVRNRADSILW